jgi:hypothetical protein
MPTKKPAVTIYLDPALYERVKSFSAAERRSMSSMIQVMLEQYLNRQSKEKRKP